MLTHFRWEEIARRTEAKLLRENKLREVVESLEIKRNVYYAEEGNSSQHETTDFLLERSYVVVTEKKKREREILLATIQWMA